MANLKSLIGVILIFLVEQPFTLNAESVIEHTPPIFELGKPLQIELKAEGAKKVSVLVSELEGIRVLKLDKVGDTFVTPIEFGKLAQIKYQFLVTYPDGKSVESSYYIIRQPANEDLENKIKLLSNELASLKLQTQNLGNSLTSLQQSDSSSMQQRKSEELGKAVLVYKKAEKENEQTLALAEKKIADWIDTLKTSEPGRYVLNSRIELENEDRNYFENIKE